MLRAMTPEAYDRLSRRAALNVNPDAPIAIKRDVHEFEIDVAADRFAAAFREVMMDAQATFGLIRVKRPAQRLGADFQVGERFQGCFSLELAVTNRLAASPLRALAAPVSALLSGPLASRVITWLEDTLLSDYAEIVAIDLEPDLATGQLFRVQYRYLDGTPLAGSSTFTVAPLGPSRCRFTQIFEYQETNGVALGTFQHFGLKLHDQVVAQQVAMAARRAEGSVLTSTVPRHYAEL